MRSLGLSSTSSSSPSSSSSGEDCGLLYDIVAAMDEVEGQEGVEDREAVIVDNVISLLIAGHDTTSSSVAMSTLLLQVGPPMYHTYTYKHGIYTV